MAVVVQTYPVVRFGAFELDIRAGQLRKHGIKIRLQQQPFQVLVLLLENPGEVVTREELQKAIWPADTFVDFDVGLAAAIYKLRIALGDSAENPRFIETLPRRGYRFIAAVEAEPVEKKRNSEPSPLAISQAKAEEVAPEVKRRWQKRGLLAAIATTALLLVTLAAMSFHKVPSHALNARDVIVLAEFANNTGESVFDGTLKEALAIDLGQSPFLNILSDARIAKTLKLMQRPSTTPLTPEVMREVCIRSDSRAVLAGSIARLGSHYALQVKATDCPSGDLLGAAGAEAENRESVLQALHKAAETLRERLGESLASIKRFDKPLDEATTSSLDALQAFSEGQRMRRQKGNAHAIPFYKHAAELDPNFALAYAELGGRYAMLGQSDLAIGNHQRAYQLRDRVSDREKYFLSATYNITVNGDLRKAGQQLRFLIQFFPNDSEAHRVSGWTGLALGRYDEAVTESTEALRLNPDHSVSAANLISAYLALNRFQEAKAALDVALLHTPDAEPLHFDLYALAFLRHDEATMQEQLDWTRGRPHVEGEMLALEAAIRAADGRLSLARQLTHEAVAAAERDGSKELAARFTAALAFIEAQCGNTAEARRSVRSVFTLADSSPIRTQTAASLVLAGYSQAESSLIERLAKQAPVNTLVQNYWLPILLARIEIQQGHALKAIEILKTATPYDLNVDGSMLSVYTRGQAYLISGHGSAAAAEFQKILDHPGLDGYELARAFAQLGLARARALEAQSLQADAAEATKAKARASYQDFLTLWKDADPNIPILQQAKAEYARLR